jgi:ubiquinone/menaquinone biosynthesis C-methylase UbiE
LLERLLRCPQCDSQLAVGPDSTVCSDGRHRFEVVDGIVVLVDDATLATDPQYEAQRRYFDAEFEGYSRYTLENWRRSYLDRLRTARVLDSGALVDVGVGGSGYTVIEAARAGSAAGCDLSIEALTTARAFAASEGVSGRTVWVCCSAERLPFADGSFAAAVAIAVLEHVPDDRAALRELARVLQPGGRAWVTVPHALRNVMPLLRPLNRRHDRRLGHLRRYEAEHLVEEGRTVGLHALDVQFTAHPVKAVQLALSRFGDRFWWFCERRDLRRAHVRRGAMHVSVLFEKPA